MYERSTSFTLTINFFFVIYNSLWSYAVGYNLKVNEVKAFANGEKLEQVKKSNQLPVYTDWCSFGFVDSFARNEKENVQLVLFISCSEDYFHALIFVYLCLCNGG